MDLSKVKNYIIIILVIANTILAGLFAVPFFSETAANRQANEQLIELLSNHGVIISELPDNTAAALVLFRDLEAEKAAAAAILGEADMREWGVGVYQYQNEKGVATFNTMGRFEINFNNSSVYTDSERGGACRDILVSMGFLNISEAFSEDKNENGGISLTFWQSIEKTPLFNARAVFEFSKDGQLLSVAGTMALGTTQVIDRTQCKSAGAVLLLFSANYNIEVESIELGYRLKLQTAESIRLTPEWRVVGGGVEYYLDGFTGVVVAAED